MNIRARRLEENRNEKVRKIEEQLNSSQNDEPTYKGPIQMFQEEITEVNLLFWISLALLAALLGTPFNSVLIAGLVYS